MTMNNTKSLEGGALVFPGAERESYTISIVGYDPDAQKIDLFCEEILLKQDEAGFKYLDILVMKSGVAVKQIFYLHHYASFIYQEKLRNE